MESMIPAISGRGKRVFNRTCVPAKCVCVPDGFPWCAKRRFVGADVLQVVGVLTVAEATVSGVYRCVASNSAGVDQLDIPFYVTGESQRDSSYPQKHTH